MGTHWLAFTIAVIDQDRPALSSASLDSALRPVVWLLAKMGDGEDDDLV
jgi:hypothetical protein